MTIRSLELASEYEKAKEAQDKASATTADNMHTKKEIAKEFKAYKEHKTEAAKLTKLRKEKASSALLVHSRARPDADHPCPSSFALRMRPSPDTFSGACSTSMRASSPRPSRSRPRTRSLTSSERRPFVPHSTFYLVDPADALLSASSFRNRKRRRSSPRAASRPSSSPRSRSRRR